ncbi:phage portal protein [Peribacillus sp. JNUCC41]|uniref:phage portal protein n=1 Tax=Peribacillus sp. JNUCC41 TaxID=2778370 RepID=UPI00177EFA5F|nr:phage portal protein [Brevibacillus sp. JNUCC-41]QOS92525.1 phage portal protein [Brevibacillus sp. JNUCC-41]
MGFLADIFKRNSEIGSSFDFEWVTEASKRVYLKSVALETCINFIGRTISQSDFRIMENNKRIRDDWDYLLNVRPNTDQSAADFWQRFIYELIHENEVLVILSDTDDLLIADSFIRNELALYPDTFESVMVKNYQFKRSFKMDEVIYLNYNNERLTKFLDGLFTDYGELFGRMMEAAMRGYQIRGTVEVETAQSLEDKKQNKLQGYIDRVFSSIKNNAVAIIPLLKGFKYNEISDGDVAGPSIDDLSKLKKSITNDVAEILGIPTALVHGEMADLEKSMKAYIKFCVGPLLKKIQDELNAKLITKKDYQEGKKFDIKGIQEKAVIENAEAVDKLVASGAFTRNQVRVLFGEERSDNPELDEYVITKNYQSASTVKGGEKNDEDTH